MLLVRPRPCERAMRYRRHAGLKLSQETHHRQQAVFLGLDTRYAYLRIY